MADASTAVLNLVFLGTVVLGLLMFLAGLALLSVVFLAAGAGRLAALLVSGVARGIRNKDAPGGAAPPDQEPRSVPHP